MSVRTGSRVALQSLPRVAKGWTFLYVEHARIDRKDHAIVLHDKRGTLPVPSAVLSVLLLGPGTSVTHEAMKTLADCGCSVVWCGEGSVRCYAAGLGETRRAANLLHQAEQWADGERRMAVVRRMYERRFTEPLPPGLSLEQVRGHEGVRVRQAYAQASADTGIPWTGRNYKRGDWKAADPVNRALSTANSCLYGLCHSAIVATGFSPGLGFIHSGKLLSFVYDIADLYKVDVTIPIAFQAVLHGGTSQLASRVRRLSRAAFHRVGLMSKIVPDIQRVLGLKVDPCRYLEAAHDSGTGLGLTLWDPAGEVQAGVNHGGGGVH